MQGEKKDPLTGQSDTDLPEIPPLRFIAGINYLPDAYTTLRAEVQTSARWDRIDSDNGEQELGGWGVLNLNINRKIGEHFEITAGIDNLFDKDYIVSNTYKDLTLVTGGDQTMLLHEPGRYAYVNLRYKF
jgi:iron complex outermembrane receptor protein